MTPPDNTEQRGSGGTTDTGTEENPPWQRVTGDDGGLAQAAGDHAGDPNAGAAPSGTGGAQAVSEGGDVAGGYTEVETQWMSAQAPAQFPDGVGTAQAPQGTQQSWQPAGGMPGGPGQQNPGGPPEMAMLSGGANGLFGAQEQTEPPRSAGPQQSGGSQQGGGSRPISALRRAGRGPRRANLQLKRVDPWSVLKLSLVLGVALFFIWLVAVGVLYTVLSGMGVWESINGTYNSLVQNDSAGMGEPLITATTVFGFAAIIGAINIVLISALSTVGAFIYNVSADLAGGLELTLSERE